MSEGAAEQAGVFHDLDAGGCQQPRRRLLQQRERGPPPTLSSRYRIASIAWSEAFESASSTLPVVACGRFSSSCSSFGQVRKMWIIGQVAQPTVR